MGKKGGSVKRSGKSMKTQKGIDEDQYDDEIDAFHKQRDIIPLDVNEDTDESDEDDDVLPVFDLKGVDDEEDDDEEDDEDEDSEDEEESENGLTAKMLRQKKYLQAKFGGVDDEMADDDKEKDEEDKKITWGGRRSQYYDGDNKDIELLSSDDDDLKEEEEEVLRIRADQAASITAADAGLDDDDSDRELTMEEISVQGKQAKKTKDDKETHVEEINKDINSLSKEEQMDVVYSSAPEIIGLLSELNDAVEELETKINPVMSKLKEGGITLNGGTKYLEVKQLLLLAYCQSITFYLLLKSEGQPVRDHPVLTRLVDIKALLDKIKELDGNLPPGFEESLARCIADGTVQKVDKEDALSSPVTITQDAVEPIKIDKSREDKKKKGEKRKHQSDQVDMQSAEMLKLRAALEGKLRNNGVLDSTVSKSDKAQKRQKLANRKLETFDDFVDDADNKKHNVTADKLTQLVIKRKSKTVSGDDDLPQRDDIGERRRKYELRILGEAGVKPDEDGKNENEALASDEDNDEDDVKDMVDDDGESEGLEDEFYKQVKQTQEAKRAAKAEIYSWKPYLEPSLPETESVDGKRLITNAMKSNRGLTRHRNKDLKNPRKKYRVKHAQKVIRRKGQVRDMRKNTGSYGGESSGINPNISRSIRIKG